MATVAGPAPVEEPGLKKGALSFVSNVVIGVASTAPAYSLAATLGLIAGVAGLGLQSPAIMIVSFLPMLCIAASYYYMNRADPDCGATFRWMTSAMGPRLRGVRGGGRAGGGVIGADGLVMRSLAYIAGQYSSQLSGPDAAADVRAAVLAVGLGWIAV